VGGATHPLFATVGGCGGCAPGAVVGWVGFCLPLSFRLGFLGSSLRSLSLQVLECVLSAFVG